MSLHVFPMRLMSPGRLHRYAVRGNGSFESRSLNKPEMFHMTRQSPSFRKRIETDQKFIRTKGDLMPCLRGNFRGNPGRKRNLLKSSPVMFNLHENDVPTCVESERQRQQRKPRKRSSKSPRSRGRQSDSRSPRISRSNSSEYRLAYSASIEKRQGSLKNTQNSRSTVGLPAYQGTRLAGRDEDSCAQQNNKNKVLTDYSKFLADNCTVGDILRVTSMEKGGSGNAQTPRVPDPNYKVFPLLQDDDNFYKPSSLQKYFSAPSAKKEAAPRKSIVIRKLFPEKRAKNRTSPSRATSAEASTLSRSRLSSPGNKSVTSEITSMTSKRQTRSSTYRPSTARRLDPTKRSTFEYFMKKLSQLSTNVQIPYQYAYPRKWEVAKETREEYADKIANVFEHNLRKFSKFKRSPKKIERKALPKAPKWKY